MKRLTLSSFFKEFSQVNHLLWHYFWVMLLSLLFMGSATAENVNLGSPCPANPLHTLGGPGGLMLGTPLPDGAEDIFAIGGGSQVVWQRTLTPPSGCTLSDGERTIDCNGVVVMTPGDLLDSSTTEFLADAGLTGDPVDVAVNPTAAGGFTFEFTATNFNGPESCSRQFYIDINEPPQPFDIGFVLDRSGSMNSNSEDTDNPSLTRWQALEEGVEGFINILSNGNVGPPELSPAPTGSQFGLTLFNSDVITNNSFPSTLVNIDSNLQSNVEAELISQSPSGGTSIGDGLEDSINNKLTDTSRPRGIVLFTDGEQNRSRFVTDDGLGFSDNAAENEADGAINYTPIPSDIKITTIGVGSPDGQYLKTLQNLAETHDSHAIITTNGQNYISYDPTVEAPDSDDIVFDGDIAEAFLHAEIDALSDNSPLFVTSNAGTLGSEPIKLPEFRINQNLRLMMINFSFSRKFEPPEMDAVLNGIRIYQNGKDITKYFYRQPGSDYTSWAVLKTDFALRDDNQDVIDEIASEGSYVIKLIKPEDIEDFDYQISPIADDSRLHAEWGVEPASRRVFEPIKPKVKLLWRDQPIKGAEVYARLLIPGDDLGDLLARNKTVVEPNQDRRDPTSPGYQKYLFLLENDPEFVERLAFQESRIKLTDPDGDGSYEGAFTLDDIAGEYQIVYQIFAKDPDLGTPIQRILYQSFYNRFGDIDIDASVISNTVDANGHPTIIWQPTTTYGRRVGPANAAAIQIKGSQEVSIEDGQDGSYVMSFGDIRSESAISISLLGEEIYRGSVCQFGKPQFGDIDLNASEIRTKVDRDGSATITWRPVNMKKLPLGANKANLIEVRGPEKTKIKDNGDGSYTMSLFGVEPDSRISIKLSCKDVYRGRLNEFGSTPEPPCKGWFCWFTDWLGRMSGRPSSGIQ